MRTRKEIQNDNSFQEYDWKRNELLLEVLLDIRELISQDKEPYDCTEDCATHRKTEHE